MLPDVIGDHPEARVPCESRTAGNSIPGRFRKQQTEQVDGLLRRKPGKTGFRQLEYLPQIRTEYPVFQGAQHCIIAKSRDKGDGQIFNRVVFPVLLRGMSLVGEIEHRVPRQNPVADSFNIGGGLPLQKNFQNHAVMTVGLVKVIRVSSLPDRNVFRQEQNRLPAVPYLSGHGSNRQCVHSSSDG